MICTEFYQQKTIDWREQEHKPPPILRPVELTLVPDSVSTFEDVANTLTRACEVCTLLSNQRTVMKNTFFLRASLITHLVTRVRKRPWENVGSVSGGGMLCVVGVVGGGGGCGWFVIYQGLLPSHYDSKSTRARSSWSHIGRQKR